ncbi:phosphatidylethanolamine-binding protein [Hysterangium stoloniferum]|nr:phosphatidylethanolamine-binding protein [Hysterangium stoloniferum]
MTKVQTPASQRKAFIQAGLVPDVLSSFHPKLVLDVTYTLPDTEEKKAVDPPGKNFTRPQTLNSPTWSIPFVDSKLSKETFVVAMVDPDSTIPQIRHFLGGDFKLEHQAGIGAVLVNNTPALTEYRQPRPSNTSDAHRQDFCQYTWLIFLQPVDFPKNISHSIRGFNISKFAEEFRLGSPLAGNFMTVSTNPADLAAAGEL